MLLEPETLYPPIQITWADQPTNGKCTGVPDYSCPRWRVSWGKCALLPPPLPPHLIISWPMGSGGGSCNQGVTWGSREKRISSTEILTEGRRGVPEASQHWLCKKPSKQETTKSVVHRYSMTRRLLWRSLKQPSVPPAGILYVQRPHPARSRAESNTTEKGRSGVWLLGSPDSLR